MEGDAFNARPGRQSNCCHGDVCVVFGTLDYQRWWRWQLRLALNWRLIFRMLTLIYHHISSSFDLSWASWCKILEWPVTVTGCFVFVFNLSIKWILMVGKRLENWNHDERTMGHQPCEHFFSATFHPQQTSSNQTDQRCWAHVLWSHPFFSFLLIYIYILYVLLSIIKNPKSFMVNFSKWH